MREFQSRPAHYQANIESGAALSASPARLHAPDGTEHPGVYISYDQKFNVVPTADAQRLALEIADIITAQRKEWT